MQRADSAIMEIFIGVGASSGRRPESFWKKTNHGNLIPACRKTPADAAASANQMTGMCPECAAAVIMLFDTKPEVRGNAEIASAPIVPQMSATGIVR